MKEKIIAFLILLLIIFSLGHFFDRGKMMTPECTAPFFSRAANYTSFWDSKFSPSEIDTMWSIIRHHEASAAVALLNNYRFRKNTPDLVSYNINQSGYVLFIVIAKKIFFWQGDILATKSFQLLIHVLIVFFVFYSLKKKSERIIFCIAYAFNPLIIYLVIFPFYYFLPVICTGVLLCYYLNKEIRFGFWILPVALLMAFLFRVRLTIFPPVMLLFFFVWIREKSLISISGILVFILMVWVLGSKQMQTNPGHTLYVGLGAYPNEYVPEMTDKYAYKKFNESTGRKYNLKDVSTAYNENFVKEEGAFLQNEFVSVFKQHPLMIFKNAALNFLQSFSLGYSTKSLLFSYISSALGLLLLIFLLYKKLLMEIFMIASCNAIYVFYFPPIPAYMFSTYLILSVVVIKLSEKLHGYKKQWKKNK